VGLGARRTRTESVFAMVVRLLSDWKGWLERD
jgi:hypothetical protein